MSTSVDRLQPRRPSRPALPALVTLVTALFVLLQFVFVEIVSHHVIIYIMVQLMLRCVRVAGCCRPPTIGSQTEVMLRLETKFRDRIFSAVSKMKTIFVVWHVRMR